MKVALVHDFLVKLGGAERVLKVFADLYPDAPIYTLLYDEKACGEVFPKERVRTSFLQKLPLWLRKKQRYLFPLMPRATESLDFSGFDLVISSSNAYVHGILTPSTCKHICYCHSPMRYVWDYAHEYLDEQKLSGFKRWMTEKLIYKVRLWDQAAADRADYYVANSEHVRKRIKKYYRTDAEVLYPPVDVSRFKVNGSHLEYYLIVQALTPFKKIDRVIQLFNKIGKRLVVIGSGAQYEYLKSIAGPNIDLLGRKDDETVAEFMKNCRGYIHACEEDFGIATVEAMACGKPVLAYGKGGALETVIPGVTGEFFYEPTIESMEDGLGRMIVNEPAFKPARIRAQAEKFSEQNFIDGWKRAVRQALRN
ncbi:glycosyltransferase [Candidatus Gracilibacteria bacterium]|nr:glycosyltransferase [Candidatus Gracilibacteria bacterium]